MQTCAILSRGRTRRHSLVFLQFKVEYEQNSYFRILNKVEALLRAIKRVKNGKRQTKNLSYIHLQPRRREAKRRHTVVHCEFLRIVRES